MAKAKKTEKEVTPKADAAPAAKAPAKSAVKAKAAAKSAAPAVPSAPPMVDTRLAAQAAAKMLAARATGVVNTTSGGNKKETSTFKQMKESLANPHSTSVGNMLNNLASNDPKKSNQHSHSNRQQGHNQTFGSDASKAFVPRRTGGG